MLDKPIVHLSINYFICISLKSNKPYIFRLATTTRIKNCLVKNQKIAFVIISDTLNFA